ncbi:MAG TPA: hypothetical protein PKX71_01915 [Candidatus Avimonas sp.]|jgi:hypothetical protein|nr:hypothetical protein [Candidatus Avimonas sp.]HQA15704.1 hypothetical protein [Candidatus Avimonas sp.]HQD37849.1 hypothetical protein [Candidatus Avimonas sp.]
MTVSELAKKLGLEIITMTDPEREITGGYVCDFLSFVIGRANPGDVWITVVGNINTVAVSLLAGAACVILAENSPIDSQAAEKAKAEGVTILRSGKSSFELTCEIGRLIGWREQTAPKHRG